MHAGGEDSGCVVGKQEVIRLIESNPAARLGRFTRSAKTTEAKGVSLTAKEVRHSLRAAKEICPYYHPLLLTAVRTGLRRGERVALQWGDVQLGADDADSDRFILPAQQAEMELPPDLLQVVEGFGGGEWTRTTDLRIMRPSL